MTEYRMKKLAKILFVIWIVCYSLTSVAFGICNFYHQKILQHDPLYILSDLQIASLLVMIFFFFPFLLLIKYYSKIARMRKLHTTICILLIPLSLWMILSVILTVSALI